MATATWSGSTIARSDDTVVEGNHHFPIGSVAAGALSSIRSHLGVLVTGTADCYDVAVGGDTDPAAAREYREPKAAADEIDDRVTLRHGVTVTA